MFKSLLILASFHAAQPVAVGESKTLEAFFRAKVETISKDHHVFELEVINNERVPLCALRRYFNPFRLVIVDLVDQTVVPHPGYVSYPRRSTIRFPPGRSTHRMRLYEIAPKDDFGLYLVSSSIILHRCKDIESEKQFGDLDFRDNVHGDVGATFSIDW